MKPNTVGRATGTDPHSSGVAGHERAVTKPPLQLRNGLVAGTCLFTLDGEIPVEFLAPGDRIVTRDVGMAHLLDIKVIDATCDAVTIRSGSLGHTRPDRNMTLPATQRILLRDWRAEALFGMKSALVPVSRLVDGEFVSQAPKQRLRLVQLVFDTPHILYADGIEVESALPALT